MTQIIELVLVVSFVCITSVALMAVLGALFPKWIRNGRQVADRMPGRSLLLGLVNLSFLAAVFVAFSGLAGSLSLNFLYLPALGVLALGVVGGSFALVITAELVAERLFPGRSALDRTWRGGLAVVLACMTPFVGWFVLLPYMVMLGFGAFIIGFFQRTEKVDDDLVI